MSETDLQATFRRLICHGLKRKEVAETIFYIGSILACLSLLLAVFNFLELRNDYAYLLLIGIILAIIGALIWAFDDLISSLEKWRDRQKAILGRFEQDES